MKLIANKPIVEKKASAYAAVMKNLNNARERGLIFKPTTAFKVVYESLGLETSARKSINMQKIWHLIQVRLRDYGVLDFDAGDIRRQPPLDTTWKQFVSLDSSSEIGVPLSL
ncbi:hypothetical protein K2173_024226 [Erythroxylum novogranatense]|uniref:Uncharacterized protein n=1 Tax=Erythroxylum novogranatense TaxID=1862640 RepID=A0AAV8UCE9_9ROSI|nr:hypothetical protein K2173_024226 [Erythroxylum novogranatense]